MTRGELLADIDRATSALASRAAQQNVGTGIPRPPTIEVSESSLETQPFNFELNSTSNAQAGADGGGGPGGGGTPSTGACCYNDGTCDDITNGDCVDAGGTFQGNGTTCADDPNPCLGVCCEPACVASSTPDSCTADGGDWQGFGTTCDDVTCPAGACCHDDGSCTIETETTCAAIPGIYKGDGTNCTDDPCLIHTGCGDCPDPIFPTICNWGTLGCLCCATDWQCCITTEPGPLGGAGTLFCCDGTLHTCGTQGCDAI